MRVLLLNYEFPPLGGGAAPVTLKLAEALAEKGHSFDLITMGFPGLQKEEQIGPIKVHRVDCVRKRKERSDFLEMLSFIKPALKKGRELCKQNKYDLIHCHFIIPTGFIARKLSEEFNISYMISCHGSDVPGYNPDRFKLLHKLIMPFWKRIIDDSKLVLAPSKHMANLVLKSYHGKTPVKSIHWGMENLPKPSKKEKLITFAGRLFERKGAQYLIDAANNIDLKDYKVMIIGDGPQRKELEEKSAGNKSIMFAGWLPREDVLKRFSRSSIFVFPSIQESFGMVVIEAMAAGNAVIAANDSAMPEVVGDAGILVEPKSSDAIKEALQNLISHPAEIKKYAAAAVKRASSFTWKKTADEYDKVYSSITRH